MGATTVASIMVSLLDYANLVCCPRKPVISLLPQPLITKPMPPFGRACGVWALEVHDKSLAQFLSEIVVTIVISASAKVSLWNYDKEIVRTTSLINFANRICFQLKTSRADAGDSCFALRHASTWHAAGRNLKQRLFARCVKRDANKIIY